ncbi:MAG: hypothetical protein ACK42H_10130 [Planctomycetota bacterium]
MRSATNTIVHLRWLACLAVLCMSTGATCIPKRPLAEFQPQPIFNAPPSIEQMAEVVNRSRNIQSLQSNFVTINPNQIRNLDASLVWQRERRFKISGGISRMMGNNFEVGSNEQYFWMSVRDGMRPQLFYARHDEFESQALRRILPVSPLWILEALGISELDPYKVMGTPMSRPDGMLEIATLAPSATGSYTRSLVIDPKYGFTRQVFLKDPTGRLVASASQSEHNFYSSVSMALPHKVLIQLIPAIDPPTEIDVTIGSYVINGLDATSNVGFDLPNQNGYEVINLVQFNQGLPQAVTPIQVAPPGPVAVPPPTAVPQQLPPTAYRTVPWDGRTLR